MASLFSKAHSADWDIDRDVDWSLPVDPRDGLVDDAWTPFGRTPTFRALPAEVRAYVNRRGLGRILNILQVGESVALNVCAKLALVLRDRDQRNHAAAQAMDEARHNLAYCRFLEKMDEEVQDIDFATEMLFDQLLAEEDPLRLVATEQFFLESMAMSIFEGIHRHATHPLLKDILGLITRDESRHMGFGVLYVREWMDRSPVDDRVAFAGRWLGQMLFAATDRPGPILLARVVRRMKEAGVADADALAPAMLAEQQELNRAEHADLLAGRRMPQVLKSARRAGLLDPEILEALGLAEHPVIRATLRCAPDAADDGDVAA